MLWSGWWKKSACYFTPQNHLMLYVELKYYEDKRLFWMSNHINLISFLWSKKWILLPRLKNALEKTTSILKKFAASMANDNYNSEFILKNGWPCFDGLILNNLPCPKKIYLRLRIKEIKNPNVSVFCTPAFPPLFVSSLYFTDLFFSFSYLNKSTCIWKYDWSDDLKNITCITY